MHWSWKCIAIMIGLIFFLLLLILGVKYSCGKIREQSFVEVGRLVSPDLCYDIIIMQDKNSRNERGVRIYIELHGASISNFDAVSLVADPIYGLNIVWINHKLLEIHYSKAQIYKFFNLYSKEGMTFGSDGRPHFEQIEIKLIKDGNEELDILRE